MERITQAIILAAGEGQRLKPFTRLMPKVMLPIAHKPILQYVVESLSQNGIRRILMVVGYRKEYVQDYFASGKQLGVEIEYITQPQQLGTAHALIQARDLADDRFLVVAGDNMIEPDTIAPLINAGIDTILIKAQDDVSRYGVVIVQDGLVKDIVEKPAEKISALVNTGTYVLSKEIFNYIGDEVRLTSVIQKMISQGHDIAVEQTEETWLDAVYPWDLLKLNDLSLGKISPGIGGTIEDGTQLKGLISIGDGSVIRSNCYIVGPVVIGENCEIGPNTCIFPSTSIGNNVVLSPFSILRNCIIENNVTIGPGASLQDSIISAGTVAGNHLAARSDESTAKIDEEYHQVKMGAIIGNYAALGDNVIIEPGVIVGNNCRVRSMKLISESIPDGVLVV